MKKWKRTGLLVTLLFLLLCVPGCGTKKETLAQPEETVTPAPVETATEEPSAAPSISYLDSIRKAILEKDSRTLYQEFRYWDAQKDSTGRFSIEMIDAFLEEIDGSREKTESFLSLVEEEFYEEEKEQITLPAVYIVVTSDTDNTRLELPVFGNRVIEKAAYKGQKLGPMLPVTYTIKAENDAWPEEKSQTIDVSLRELSNDMLGKENDQALEKVEKHTYYVNFRKDGREGQTAKATASPAAVSGRVVAIDAGHQAHGNSEPEPVGPGASETKPKVASGTEGCVSGLAEYELTLAVSKKLRSILQEKGYQVVMIRESNDVNISNRERAEIANDSGAQIFVRIHADSSESSDPSGCSTLYPGEGNPYVSDISSQSKKLSESIVNHLSAKTGCQNRGAVVRDDMSGINWCRIPVSIVEMGFMSNPQEDRKMATEEYQQKLAEGIAEGIEAYYGQ